MSLGQPVSHANPIRPIPRLTHDVLVFKVEALLTLAVIIYALGWYVGKSTNANIVSDW